MKISHAAIYTKDLERLKDFYTRYFGGTANEMYENHSGFRSYFIRFDSEVALELMTNTNGLNHSVQNEMDPGYSHIAFSVGDKPAVNELTQMLRADGFTIASEPRTTGDGYYESCVLDPDGNRVEITC